MVAFHLHHYFVDGLTFVLWEPIHIVMDSYPSQNSNGKSQNLNSKYKSDLKVRSYKFSLSLIKILDGLPNESSSQIIAKQLLRSGTSIGANLVEAQSSSSRLEFKKFHEIALKSANETRYWIGLLRDSGKLDTATCNTLLTEATELSNMIASGVMRLKAR